MKNDENSFAQRNLFDRRGMVRYNTIEQCLCSSSSEENDFEGEN